MNELTKAKILHENFGLFGIGNFDLTIQNIAEIIQILNLDDCEEIKLQLERLYKKLHFEYFGYYIENLERINHAPC